jgi:hypothetical protein
MINKELITYNDKLYWVFRRVKEKHIKENHINDLRDIWSCDLVLRTKNQDEVWLVYVVEIKDAVLVEENI